MTRQRFTNMSTKIKQKDLAKLPECACFNLRKTARAVSQLYDKVLKPVGLRGTQFSLLAAIARSESITISHLAERLVMERTTLTRNLRPLEKQGLIKVIPGMDLRTRVVTLTTKGYQTLDNALPLWERAQARFVEGFGQQHFQHFLTELSSTITMAQKK